MDAYQAVVISLSGLPEYGCCVGMDLHHTVQTR